MAEHFLSKDAVDLARCLEIDGALAIDQHARLDAFLTGRAGPETARLFAEPLLSRGNDQAPPTVSWYSDREGVGRPLGSLDAGAQAEIGAQLGRALAPLRDLLADPETGDLLGAALHLRGEADIRVVDGAPLLLNWGMLAPGVGREDGVGRAAQYRATLGRFLPLDSAPPLNDSERGSLAPPSVAPAVAAGGVVTGSAAMVAGHASGTTPGEGGAPPSDAGSTPPRPPADAPRRLPLVAWVPLCGLLLLAGVVLAWLLMPATRIFPAVAGQAIPDAAALELAARTNRALQERLTGLQVALDGAVCRADGTLLMPDGHTIEGLLPPDPSNPNDGPGTAVAALSTPVLPPDPARAVVDDPSGAPDKASLLALIEARTLFVWVTEAGGVSTGTGFVVGPGLVVTNFHVVEHAAPDGIFVTNKALGRVVPAQLVKAAGPLEAAGADFALLRVPGVVQPAFDILQTPDSLRLQSVIAAGYPGDVLQTDRQFAALQAGDARAVPELTVTDGSVNTEQQLGANTNALVHSATISTGNSGGPLIDMCGRLVGVNTFVLQGPLRNLNVALSAKDLLTFLSGEGAGSNVVTAPCTPRVQRPVPPPPEVAQSRGTDPAGRP